MPKPKIDANDLPGDSEERLNFALNLKDGLTPHGVIDDWGDFDNDYPDTAHDRANANPQSRDSSGVGYSSPGEVEAYYDSLMAEDIRITGGKDHED